MYAYQWSFHTGCGTHLQLRLTKQYRAKTLAPYLKGSQSTACEKWKRNVSHVHRVRSSDTFWGFVRIRKVPHQSDRIGEWCGILVESAVWWLAAGSVTYLWYLTGNRWDPWIWRSISSCPAGELYTICGRWSSNRVMWGGVGYTRDSLQEMTGVRGTKGSVWCVTVLTWVGRVNWIG